ncbi:MAG: N-acetyltransferase [Deltaproteobacteria bacterium]|nr:N-acetyltransferase [Deltaproteobacteria bacterium]
MQNAALQMTDEIPQTNAGGARVRPASLADVKAMAALIDGYARQGVMLPRTPGEISETVREYLVAEREGRIIGAGAIHFFTEDLAEVRALAVAPELRGNGIGSALLGALTSKARREGASRLFTLTYEPAFFESADFERVPHEALPEKVWGDCTACPRYNQCGEIALVARI